MEFVSQAIPNMAPKKKKMRGVVSNQKAETESCEKLKNAIRRAALVHQVSTSFTSTFFMWFSYLLALGEVMVVVLSMGCGAQTQLFPQEKDVTCFLNLGEAGDFLQLPLMLKD